MRRKVGLVVLLAASLPLSVAAQHLLANGPLGPPPVPADSPQTDAKIRLGQQLYFDTRLSADNSLSCATCHDPRTGWANHHPTDTGIRGQVGERNSGTIVNAAFMRFQFWDGRAASLEEQATGPIHNPIEMGETLENVVNKLNAIPGYREQFQQVFGGPATADSIAKAIAAFERTILSGPSPYDRFVAGETSALSPAAQRGLRLFVGKGRCLSCHGGPTFSDQGFHNLGVGYDRPKLDLGRESISHDERDRGRFKTPGLRNVAMTAPYLHNGSEKTLRDVVDFYDRGGIDNANIDPLILPLRLSEGEKDDLVAFLESLTGPYPILSPPAFPPGGGQQPDALPNGGLR